MSRGSMRFGILYHPIDDSFELYKLTIDRHGFNSRKPLPRHAIVIKEIVAQRYGEGSIFFKGFIEGLKHAGIKARVRASTHSPRPKKEKPGQAAFAKAAVTPGALEQIIKILWKGGT